MIEITPWHWAAFILCVLFFLALDLGFLRRNPRAVTFHDSLRWSIFWCTLAILFAVLLVFLRGRGEAIEFITGYVIELSLSMDNVFVIALIFAFFHVAPRFQHRVLFWGILGALLMRGALIGVGSELVQRFQWTLYFFGAFLVFTGVKMLLVADHGIEPEKNPVIRIARKFFPIARGEHGEKFFVKLDGRKMLTTLFLVLLLIETTDLIFALDSIPAIFAVTTKPFIVFTSNIFAILGLRSLYFVLAGALGYFRFLKIGLSIVLVFVGAKMLFAPHNHPPQWFQFEIPTFISLIIIAAILILAMIASVMAKRGAK